MKKVFVLSVMAIAAGACNQPPAEQSGRTVIVTMPTGNAQAGRQAFADLKCTACHAVPSDSGFPAPVSANPGPLIDAVVANRDVSYLATAIVSPSHQLSPDIDDSVRAQLTGVLSPMGDFSRVMTVRQLVDLHTFLLSVK